MPISSEIPELLRELATSPAWEAFFLQVDQWIKDGQEELEASDSYNEFLVTKGGILALRKIAGWKIQLREEMKELKYLADSEE